MDTIPLKRHEPEKMTKKKPTTPQTPLSSIRTMQAKGVARKRTRSVLWAVVIVVIVVAVTGLLILRFSRASEQGTAPLTATQLQSYIKTQLATQDPATINKQLAVSQYAQFQFGSKITPTPAYVSWYVDDVPVAKATTSPFTFVWDSSRYSNGVHTLTTVAYDANDQPLGATKRTVVVDNSDSLVNKARNIVTYPWYWLFQL